jgi:hypothetical protein
VIFQNHFHEKIIREIDFTKKSWPLPKKNWLRGSRGLNLRQNLVYLANLIWNYKPNFQIHIIDTIITNNPMGTL